MASTELVLTNSQRIELPAANHEGFRALAQRANRLPQCVPGTADAKMLLAAIIAEANKPALHECAPLSVVTAAFNCALLGLTPGGTLGMAHFVAYGKTATLVIGYKGWVELAYASGFLRDVHTEVVLRDEEFSRWTDERGAHFKHVPDLECDRSAPAAWEQLLFAYCVWHSTTGGSGFEIVGHKELRRLRAKSRGGVWESHPIAMARKTPVIRAAKTWKRTKEIGYAAALEDAIEAERPQPALVPLDVESEPGPSLAAFDEPKPGEAAFLEPQMTRELAATRKPTEITDIEFKYGPTLGTETAKRLADQRRAELAKG